LIVDYPNIPFSYESSCEPRPSIEFDPMSDGFASGRVATENVVYDVTFIHPLMTREDAASIRQHFRDHRTDTIRLIWDGDVYEGGYIGEPSVKKNGVWRTVTSRFVANLASELDAFQLQTGEYLQIGGETLE